MNIQKRIVKLKKEIDEHNINYYVYDNPTISDNEYDLLLSKLQELENQRTQRVMHEIIEENKPKGNTDNKNLIIGMTKDRVVDYISMPDSVEFITSSLDSFEIWVYNESSQRLFFKNNKLYHVQNLEE